MPCLWAACGGTGVRDTSCSCSSTARLFHPEALAWAAALDSIGGPRWGTRRCRADTGAPQRVTAETAAACPTLTATLQPWPLMKMATAPLAGGHCGYIAQPCGGHAKVAVGGIPSFQASIHLGQQPGSGRHQGGRPVRGSMQLCVEARVRSVATGRHPRRAPSPF